MLKETLRGDWNVQDTDYFENEPDDLNVNSF
jgi:hypothetical protein